MNISQFIFVTNTNNATQMELHSPDTYENAPLTFYFLW